MRLTEKGKEATEDSSRDIKPKVQGTLGKPKFPLCLGRILITETAEGQLSREEVATSLLRHQNGDWGDLNGSDEKANEDALSSTGRLFSSYHSRSGETFCILTDADRKVTTVFMPDDY